jgi:hypothetical protein
MRAAKSLITSGGRVAAGGELPEGLESGEIERLRTLGAIAVQPAPAAPEAPSRDDIIAGIIEGLPDEGFTQAGKPDVDAINKALPEGAERVTAAERDLVWDAMETAD